MRAWQLHETGGPDSFSFDEIDTPEPGPGEVRIKLKISALNHLDLWVSRGLPAPKHLPAILGADGAGTVSATGPGVRGLEIGDDVIANPSTSCGTCRLCLSGEIVFCRRYAILGEHRGGTLAEEVIVPAVNAVPKPPEVDWDTAGSFGLAAGTAYRMLKRARLRGGETLLVVGVGGGVSSAAMLIGTASGARVFVTSRHQTKIDWAIANGAEAGFDSASAFSKEVKELSVAADVVVENVGPATWDQSVRSLAPGGRMVVCGSTSGTKVELTLPVLFFKQIEILGSTMFTHQEFDETLALIATGAVRPPVDHVFPVGELPAALARLDAGDQLGKVALAW